MVRKIIQKLKTNLKPTAGIIVLLSAIILLPIAEAAWAGERWDRLSLSVKSTVGNIVPGAGNYIKTTNFGIGQRIGGIIDQAYNVTNKIGNSLKRQEVQQTPFERSGALIGATYETKIITAKAPDNSTDNSSILTPLGKSVAKTGERFVGGARYVAGYLAGAADNLSKSPFVNYRLPGNTFNSALPNPLFPLRVMHDYIKNQLLNRTTNMTVVNKSSLNQSNYTPPFPGFGTPYQSTEQISITRTPINESGKEINKSSREKFADGLLAEWIGNKYVTKAAVNHRNSFGVGMYTRIVSRTEYTVTDMRTNQTTKINENVFRNLLNNSTPQK